MVHATHSAAPHIRNRGGTSRDLFSFLRLCRKEGGNLLTNGGRNPPAVYQQQRIRRGVEQEEDFFFVGQEVSPKAHVPGERRKKARPVFVAAKGGVDGENRFDERMGHRVIG